MNVDRRGGLWATGCSAATLGTDTYKSHAPGSWGKDVGCSHQVGPCREARLLEVNHPPLAVSVEEQGHQGPMETARWAAMRVLPPGMVVMTVTAAALCGPPVSTAGAEPHMCQVHTHAHACRHAPAHTDVHTQTYVETDAHTGLCTHVCMHRHLCTHAYRCAYSILSVPCTDIGTWKQMHIQVCIHTYACTHRHLCPHTHRCTHSIPPVPHTDIGTWRQMHTQVYAHTYACTGTCVYTYRCTRNIPSGSHTDMYVCTHLHTHAQVPVHTHIQMHPQRPVCAALLGLIIWGIFLKP